MAKHALDTKFNIGEKPVFFTSLSVDVGFLNNEGIVMFHSKG